MRHTLGWNPWTKQIEIARALQAAIDGTGPRRIAVRSGNGVGKTAIAARLMLWTLRAFQHAIVITTAPTERQVEHILWREARQAYHASLIPLGGNFYDGQARWDLGPTRYALGLSPQKHRPENFQGYHARLVLFIVDEASGVPEPHWEAIKGSALAGNAVILSIGNPTRNTGDFYDSFHRNRALTKTLHISAFDYLSLTGPPPPDLPPDLSVLLPPVVAPNLAPGDRVKGASPPHILRGKEPPLRSDEATANVPPASPQTVESVGDSALPATSVDVSAPPVDMSLRVCEATPSRPPALDKPTESVGHPASPTTSVETNPPTSPAGTPAVAAARCAGLVTFEALHNAYLDWGPDSPLWHVRILGNFPPLSDRALFSLDWLERAAILWESLTLPATKATTN